MEDIAFIVCDALQKHGTVAVLTGGSAATFYTPESYASDDIDFIITFRAQGAAKVLRDIGFLERSGAYVHPASKYLVEFPPGPLAVGDDLITVWDTVEKSDRTLHVITRTDCVRDRLAAYYHWNDYRSLHVACDVARSGAVDWNVIRNWSDREGHMMKFTEFWKLVNG
ncbi:MAG: hypothetical protein JO043_11645 [Candidatus Eremiobacteraeota bacterium]|nr:hypothetical protein [Candidatus Eremiobacteraeota bacterium]